MANELPEGSIETIKSQYKQLLDKIEQEGNPISLTELFGWLDEMSKDFEPSEYGEESLINTRRKAMELGIWLDFSNYSGLPVQFQHLSEWSATMSMYLHANTVSLQRQEVLDLFYTLLFTIDDLLSDNAKTDFEQFEDKKQEFQKYAVEIKLWLEGKKKEEDLKDNKIFIAIGQIIKEIHNIFSDSSEGETWVNSFMQINMQHLSEALGAQNSVRRGKKVEVLSWEDIHDFRYADSGMGTTIKAMELATGSIINWNIEVAHNGANVINDIKAAVDTMNRLNALICAYVNDLCSFHKEVYEAESNLNLVAVYMIKEGQNIEEAINSVANVVNELKQLYDETEKHLIDILSNLFFDNDTLSTFGDSILNHLECLEVAFKATWVWQITKTGRYLSKDSLFLELRENPEDFLNHKET